MTAIYNGLVQRDQNAQDTEDDAGNGGKTLWSTEGHCEKMDAVAPPSTAQKKGCLSGRLSSLVFADYRELRPVSFPNDLGGFVDGDPTLAGVVGRFRYKFGFYRLFNGMLGLKFCLLAHDANHSTLWALDERPLRRVVELRYTGHAETSSIMIGSDGGNHDYNQRL
ncbi:MULTISPECIES: hypothetical protein [unclassified Mesorhizobium]|uniref:hypothetical protein n=1 Tax=unclassified Mesorhizobium TaxID=325217 RepID=UPI00167E00C3|nr:MULTISPECIES: hypothetical protein [unclassified Mesorhizobium]